MSLYVLPENQELIWKTISKVPQFQQMNNTQNEKHIWFRNVIQMFHEKTSPNIDVNQLRQLNKETIQFMMKDLKNQKTFQPLSEINNLGNHSLQPPFSNNQGSYIETNKTQTRDYMHEQKQMQLTDQFASKQKEYESFLQKPTAREINFKENEQDDKPIENLDELMQRQLKEREYEVQTILPPKPQIKTEKFKEDMSDLEEVDMKFDIVDLETSETKKKVSWADEQTHHNKETQFDSVMQSNEDLRKKIDDFIDYVKGEIQVMKDEIANLKKSDSKSSLENTTTQKMKNIMSQLQSLPTLENNEIEEIVEISEQV